MNSYGTQTLFDFRGRQVETECDVCQQKHTFDGDWLIDKCGDEDMPGLLKTLATMLECPRVENVYKDRCMLHYGAGSRPEPAPEVERPPITKLLSDLAENEGLIARCQGCGRKRDLARWALIGRFGGGTEIKPLESRMRCLCGHRGARLTVGRMKR
ncbi:hypothetical protein [Rhizobium rhizogenes]|uniref:hypothetical protein n=1 Tax=Rhizobium rhizogenes TaxID=359 RepID=UPI001159D83B|nr:hypothetical protein [Rhizobium rhizogenes]NTI80480.1 hypothetical protein [Rhizobium rhizogenes]NTJ22666.1 hypothetical protein [Rhizobium rhizogenes]QUE81370.1 hypothetical protein EML492_06060 [Rhizobium rhizogenes]TQO80535.1 hypothetical protein FFE80_05380 [Rhizobium rhizogenes]TRB52494.1 hypothetical protein EXN69_22880 [Rhizobium rhizogenes]